MHLLYRSTGFCIPAEKKLFGCAMLMADQNVTFISDTCSTQFKPFHPLINLSLTHSALSILSQHTTVYFHRFCSFCPKKLHYVTFFDGAILQRSVHVFALVAATRMKAERCTSQALPILRNASAPICPGYSVNLKTAFTFWFTLIFSWFASYSYMKNKM